MIRNGYQHMVLDEYVRQVREITADRKARLDAISTPEEARAYQQRVRDVIRQSFTPQAGLPPKTPLNAKITRVIEQEAFRIENVVLESRPGFLVTANLRYPTLKQLFPQVRRITGNGSMLIISGFRVEETADLLDLYRRGGFEVFWQKEEKGWAGAGLIRG